MDIREKNLYPQIQGVTGQISNSNSTIFKILKWLADPFALALISPPLALSTKT
jgi:pSer/pThr/pTyr-binding forkhead associated (FHA) protein